MTKPLFDRSRKLTFQSVKMTEGFKSSGNAHPLTVSMQENMFNMHAIMSLIFWYLFSFLTLFMNKYTLDTLRAEPFLFCECLMLFALKLLILFVAKIRNMCNLGGASLNHRCENNNKKKNMKPYLKNNKHYNKIIQANKKIQVQ